MIGRRRVVRMAAAALALLVAAAAGVASAAATQGAGDIGAALRVLAEERTLAINGARMLERFGKVKPDRYAHGINLYGEAEAAFNGLIEQLKAELTLDKPSGQSADFKAALDRAVQKREAFVRFVQEDVLPAAKGHKNPWPAMVVSGTELVKGLGEVAVRLWEGSRQADQAARMQVRGQLEAQKWPSWDQARRG